jgi:hypothetical protein
MRIINYIRLGKPNCRQSAVIIKLFINLSPRALRRFYSTLYAAGSTKPLSPNSQANKEPPLQEPVGLYAP